MVIQLHLKIDIFNAINVELNTRTILAKIQNSYGANNQFNKPSNGMRHSVYVSLYVCVCNVYLPIVSLACLKVSLRLHCSISISVNVSN